MMKLRTRVLIIATVSLCGCAGVSHALSRAPTHLRTAGARRTPAAARSTPQLGLRSSSPAQQLAAKVASAMLGVALALQPPVLGAPAVPAAWAEKAPYVKSSDSGIGLFVNKDGKSILRLTLPKIAELPALPEAQELVETIKLRFDQVGYKRDPVWAAAAQDAGSLKRTLEAADADIRAKVPSSQRADVGSRLDKIKGNLQPLEQALREKDIGATTRLQQTIANDLADLQLVLLPKKTLPYELPDMYKDLPQLRGRAEVEMKLEKGKGNKKRFCAETGNLYAGRYGMSYSEMKAEDADKKGFECAPENTDSDATIRLTLDGYHAPITAGNFLALVKSGFFDGMPIQQLTDLSIQTGNAAKAGKTAPPPIPLEIFYKRDAAPTYSFTSDEDKRASETLALPFQSYGALGMARISADFGAEVDNDSATSEFFFVKYDQALLPPGRNTLDGAYSCFGYTSEGAPYLKQLEVGDVIKSAKVLSGLENFKPAGGK